MCNVCLIIIHLLAIPGGITIAQKRHVINLSVALLLNGWLACTARVVIVVSCRLSATPLTYVDLKITNAFTAMQNI